MRDNKKGHKIQHWNITPSQAIILGFIAVIILGALLLNLPLASSQGQSIGFLDALFTATSATCVTGLVVVNTMEYWSWFGKGVLLLLIQIGGMGFITLVVGAMMFLHRRISLRDRLVIQASFNQNRLGGMIRFVVQVVKFTLAAEGIGAVLLTLLFWKTDRQGVGQAVIRGIFHSVSAFCNAGFDIIGPESLMSYVGNIGINLVIAGLIIAGGLGFPVWLDLLEKTGSGFKGKSLRYRCRKLSLHSKIALTATGVFVLAGMILFLALEWKNGNTLGGLSFHQKLTASMFQSVTLRTAGFNTIDQGGLTEASQFVSSLLMMVGGSPAGTAGGIKTVTTAIIFISMFSLLRGRDKIEVYNRNIPLELLQKALAVTFLVFTVVIAAALILCFTEQGNGFDATFLEIFYECASAAGTAGLTTGLTPYLSIPGKLIIIFCMFMGRIGPITIAVALSIRLMKGTAGLSFPDEKVLIG